MTIFEAILAILGLAAEGLPLLEKIASPALTWIANEYSTLFGTSAAQKLESDFATVTQIANTVASDVDSAIAYVKNNYSSLDNLLGDLPWVAQLLFAINQVEGATGTSTATASQLVTATAAIKPKVS